MTRCKACLSPNRQFIDQQFAIGTPARVIVEELAARGETFSLGNLYTHKNKHLGGTALPNPTLDRAMEALRQRVELEIESAPTPALAAGWIIVLDQLEGLRASKKTPASLIGALKMMNQLGGVSTEQASLLSYMNARWPQEKPTLRAVPEEG